MAAYQYIYVMKGLGKTYPGGREVLRDIWLSFLPGAKIGVLGLNGAGKSTLLRIMAGQEREFSGEAWAAEGARVGFLPQEPALDPTRTWPATSWRGWPRPRRCSTASRRSAPASPRICRPRRWMR